jgi:hypothetical protein
MRRHFLWPIMVLVAAGCGDGTGPTATGTFQATVSGSVSAELEGVAEFGISTGEGLGLSFRRASHSGCWASVTVMKPGLPRAPTP